MTNPKVRDAIREVLNRWSACEILDELCGAVEQAVAASGSPPPKPEGTRMPVYASTLEWLDQTIRDQQDGFKGEMGEGGSMQLKDHITENLTHLNHIRNALRVTIPIPAGASGSPPSPEEQEIALDDRKAIEQIASECSAAGFDTPDGTALGAVRLALRASSGSPPSPIEGENDCSTGCGKLADVSTEYHEEMCHGCYIDMLELIIERKDRALAERAEACAKVCKGRVTGFKSDLHEAYDNGARDCAEHIRAKFCDELRASSGSTGAPDDAWAGLDAQAVAELESFREHLEHHKEASPARVCRFCEEKWPNSKAVQPAGSTGAGSTGAPNDQPIPACIVIYKPAGRSAQP